MKAVDLFSGWGGFTAGATQAGVRVVYAANHWQLAVDVHAANHPDTLHVCQDLRQADWTALPEFECLLAAPACPGHSNASLANRRPYHDEMRGTAWSVVDCAEVTSPKAIVVENVPQFARWNLYPVWCDALRRLGYRLTEVRIVAADHGVPQLRDRLFVVGMRRRAFALPFRFRQAPPFAPCIEETAGGWRPVAKAMPGARARILAGRARHGARFLSQHVTDHPGVALSEPIRTITTQDHWVLVDGDRYRPLTLRELARGMGFADSYLWPADASRADVLRGIGNAVCPPVARDLVRAVAEAA